MRTNAGCELVAKALGDRGIPARVGVSGLLSTPEVRFVRAAFRWLVDRSPAAAMEVAWWGGGAAPDPDAWLGAAFDAEAPFEDDPRVGVLRSLVREAAHADPIELFDRILTRAGVAEVVAAWPDGSRRLANLEAARGELRGWLDDCALDGRAATLAGWTEHLDRLELGGADAADRQALSDHVDAVTVVTWHQSKGLEWPVVVLGSLSFPVRSDPFDVDVEPAASFDLADPLAGRRVRWWADPFPQVPSHAVRDAAARSTVARARGDRDREERVRLLYVGFTRARDRLILPIECVDGERQSAWLDDLADGGGEALIHLPWGVASDEVAEIEVAGESFPCVYRIPRGGGASHPEPFGAGRGAPAAAP